MYQLSRLLHDYHRRLYTHLEEQEIGPSLYAAPWFLTLFASQFPLGFVSRIFGTLSGTRPFRSRRPISPPDAPKANRCPSVSSDVRGNLVVVYFVLRSDFLFIRGTEVVFKVALCLLSSHEEEIMECDSFYAVSIISVNVC